jgi:hypothetical protein
MRLRHAPTPIITTTPADPQGQFEKPTCDTKATYRLEN